MQKKRCFALLMALLMLSLFACTQQPDTEDSPTPDQQQQESVDHGGEGVPEIVPPPADEEDEAEAAHSEFYLPVYSVEQVIEAFEEVVLDVEYSDGVGDVHLVQKWLSPIRYRIYGTPTDTDREVLAAFFEQLNAISGFPGIYAAEEGAGENLSISFLYPEAFRDSFSAVVEGEDAYGAVQFWYYLVNNEIHTARIGYRTDVEQNARNSILPEEVVNMLGVSDTVLRTDSITYQYSDDNFALSDMDLLILKLLYHPEMESGMDAAACESVIRRLYY